MASTYILSDNGVSSGSNGIKVTGGNDGVLILQTSTSGGTATNALTIDNKQNIGIGTTPPSAWLTANVLALGPYGGSLVGSTTQAGMYLTSNAYYDTGWKYVTTGYATQYRANENTLNGSHIWLNAQSGSAGSAITFSQAMTLDVNGNLALSIAPSTNSLSGSGYRMLEVGTRAGSGLFCGGYETYVTSNTIYNSGFKYAATAAAAMYAQSNGSHYWYTSTSGTAGNSVNTTPSMQLSTNGNLYMLTANGGIVFNKSGGLNNTVLNDYEQGTWTPGFSPGSASTANFTYTKIGRIVQLTGYISSPSGFGSGSVSISGLPFAGSGNYQMSMLWYNGVATTLAAAYLSDSSTTLILRPIGGAPSTFTELSVQMSYITAS